MRKALVVLAALGMLVLAGCGGGASAVQRVDPQAFADAANTQGVVILDVRTPEEFAAGHLAGARNLSVEDPGFAAAIGALDPGATYAVYCHSGRRSGIAVAQMADAGLTRIVELEGGLQAWERAGGALTTN